MNSADELKQAALRLPAPPPSPPPCPFWKNIGLSATKVAPAPLLLGTSISNSAPSAGSYLLCSPILADVTEIRFSNRSPACPYYKREGIASISVYIMSSEILPSAMPLVDCHPKNHKKRLMSSMPYILSYKSLGALLAPPSSWRPLGPA